MISGQEVSISFVMWLLRSSRYECKASSCEVERYNNMSSGKLVGSGVSVSSGASASMGFDQGGIVAPADGRRSMEVRRLYLDSTRLSENTVPWLGCDNVSMYDPSWRASRSIDEVSLWQIAFFSLTVRMMLVIKILRVA